MRRVKRESVLAVFHDRSGMVLPGSNQTPDTSSFGIQSASLSVDTPDTTPPTVGTTSVSFTDTGYRVTTSRTIRP